MEYVGRDYECWRGWVAVKLRYGRVIRLLDKHGRKPRYWTHSEELDAIDDAQGCSVYDAEYEKLLAQHTAELRTTPKARRLAKDAEALVAA